MRLKKPLLGLAAWAVLSTASAGSAQIEFSSSHVTNPQADGSIELLVTGIAKLPLGFGGVGFSIPTASFFESAAAAECPNGYTTLSQELPKTHVYHRQLTSTQRSLIRCKSA